MHRAALENERKYHLEQIERINTALDALKGHSATTRPAHSNRKKRRVAWAKEITNIFKGRISEQLSPAEIRDALFNKGITEVNSQSNRNAIYTTLTRLTRKGVLEKIEAGLYQIKQRELTHMES